MMKSLDDVPFSILAALYNDLRSAKVVTRKRFRGSYAKAQGETRRAMLTAAWLKIAQLCGYGGDAIPSHNTNGGFIPARVFPPEQGLKLLCLLVPTLDSVHAYLGMKETKLADAFVKALDLTPNGDDAQWLKHHRETEYRPQRWKQDADIVDGNFATVLKAVLTDRCPTESSLTIGIVWNVLGALSRVSRGRLSRIAKTQNINVGGDADSDSTRKFWEEDLYSQPEDAKALALRKIVQIGTSTEVAEVARIILKELDIRLSEDFFFSWFHPGAKQHYMQIHDIPKLLKDCADPNFEIGEASVQVGQYASVMLTMRPSRKGLDVICENLRGNGGSIRLEESDGNGSLGSDITMKKSGENPSYFIMEPKLDGERLQLHKWKTGSEDSLAEEYDMRTFSRKGNDSSPLYADALRQVVLSAVHAQDVILDGEIMIWDDLRSCWLPFDDTRQVATNIAKKSVPDGCSYTLKYMVFDVLYVDQGSKRGDSRRTANMVIRLPLFQRRRLLEKVIEEKEVPYGIGAKTRIGVVHMERGHDEKELIQALQRYETLGYEGVIAKHPDRPYVLAERSLDISIKLKSDYFDGGIVDLDVLIMGAKYSASRGHRVQRAGRLSSFLIGVRADETHAPMWKERGEEWEERMKKSKWVPIGSVGTGYSDVELGELQKLLRGEWRDFDFKELPNHFEDKEYTPGLLSEVAKWIEPWKSVVLTVRAFALNRRYRVLRFPRVERINWEKPYHDVATYNHVLDLDDNKQPAFVRADETDADEVGAWKVKKKSRKGFDAEEEAAMTRVQEEGHLVIGGRNARSVMAVAKGVDVSKVERVCDAMEGMTFFVIAGDVAPKEGVEVKIHQMGGRFVQNFGADVNCVICTSAHLTRVRTLKEMFEERKGAEGTCDIVHSRWIEECLQHKEKVTPSLSDVVFATSELEEELFAKTDRFGDGWVEDTDAESLGRSIEEVEKWRNKEDEGERVEEIEERIAKSMKECGNVFWGMVIATVGGGAEVEGCVGVVRALGGKIVEAMDGNVTHVLVHSSEMEGWETKMKEEEVTVVTERWVWKLAAQGLRVL